MQNIPQISQFMGYFYPIWLTPPTSQAQDQYLSPANFYATFFTPLPNHFQNQSSSPQDQAPQKIDDDKIITEKEKDKAETKVVEENRDIQNKTIENLQIPLKQNLEVDKLPAAKKPILYKTQKSFFMKQKIKGGLKNNLRILRKRIQLGSKNSIKSKLRTTNTKRIEKGKKESKKKQKSEKVEKRIKNIPKQLNVLPMKKLIESAAEIPSLTCGVRELNQLISGKLQALRLRQVGKK